MTLSNVLNNEAHHSSAVHIQWCGSALKKTKSTQFNILSCLGLVLQFCLSSLIHYSPEIQRVSDLLCLCLHVGFVSSAGAYNHGSVNCGPRCGIRTFQYPPLHCPFHPCKVPRAAVGKLQMQNANVMTH